jgi:hypothetical protein
LKSREFNELNDSLNDTCPAKNPLYSLVNPATLFSMSFFLTSSGEPFIAMFQLNCNYHVAGNVTP